MNILIPRVTMPSHFDALWRKVKPTWVSTFVTHKAQLLAALCWAKMWPMPSLSERMVLAGLLGRPLRGAGASWESLFPLPYDPTATLPVDITLASSADMMILGNIDILEIGACYVVAGTVTALAMDFDLYPTTNDAAGTVVDKLDGTNGVITAPTVASQAIGAVLYKDLADTVGAIAANKGSSIRAIVTTTTTAGSATPYALATSRAMNNANISTLVASS